MKRDSALFVVLATCLLLAACSGSSGSRVEPPDTRGSEVTKPEGGRLTPLAEGNNEFAWAMYGQLAPHSGNIFFSPFSIRTALAMTHAGARGETAAQIATALHFRDEGQPLHSAFKAERDEVLGNSGDVELTITNSLWGQSGYEFLEPFVSTTNEYHGGELKRVSFSEHWEGARAEINGWVEEQTRDRIQDLIPAGALDQYTRLVLVNAMYFKGSWLRRFGEKMTKDSPFHVSKDETVTVKLMHQESDFDYYENPNVQVLQLPYRGKRLAMMVVLPKERHGLAVVETTLTPAEVQNWVGKLEEREVDVYVPRFRIEGQTIPLEQQLSDLGMPLPFNPERADFSGVTSEESLHISNVFHQAFVEVDEVGTEAAAATGVLLHAMSERIRPAPTPVFRADHPFIFILRDTKTGNILFLGRLTKPA